VARGKDPAFEIWANGDQMKNAQGKNPIFGALHSHKRKISWRILIPYKQGNHI
jgi:hypothetical protein